MKKIILLIISLLFLTTLSIAQVGYVSIDDEIYPFLNRMNTIGVINNYNSFEIPKSRKQIKNHLIEILQKVENLDQIDQNNIESHLSNKHLALQKYQWRQTLGFVCRKLL